MKEKMKNSLEGTILDWFFPIWRASQVPLYEVKRWGGMNFFKGENDIIGLRQQSVLEHVHSFSRFVDTAVLLIDPYIRMFKHTFLDKELILRCCRIHDDGEGLLGVDIKAPQKTEQDDLNEYVAYMEHIQRLPKTVRNINEHAFLLQFALNNSPCFPNKAKRIMKEIMKSNYYEAVTFHIMEKFEYIFFPLELKDFDGDLLANVIKRQLPFYQKYVENNLLPGFREEIFTEQVENWMLEYLEKHPVKIFN